MAGENIPQDLKNAIGIESSPLDNDIEKGAIHIYQVGKRKFARIEFY